jgi:hypothetical protein
MPHVFPSLSFLLLFGVAPLGVLAYALAHLRRGHRGAIAVAVGGALLMLIRLGTETIFPSLNAYDNSLLTILTNLVAPIAGVAGCLWNWQLGSAKQRDTVEQNLG